MKRTLFLIPICCLLLSGCSLDDLKFWENNKGNDSTEKDNGIIYFDVSYYLDGNILKTIKVAEGSKLTKPSSEETPGYSVSNWYTIVESEFEQKKYWLFDENSVNRNLNLYAEFDYSEYTITLIDEKFESQLDSVAVQYKCHYDLPLLEEIGFTFNGWEYNGEIIASSGTYLYTNNIVVIASWNAKSYTITLDPNGGSVSESTIVVTYGEEYNLPTPFRDDGYVFLGWYENDNFVSSSGVWEFAESKNFEARWVLESNYYVLDAGEGQCNIDSIEIEPNTHYSLPTPTCPHGFLFDGWYLGDTYIPQEGTWIYLNTLGILTAYFYDENISISNSYEISGKNQEASSYVIPGKYHGHNLSIASSGFKYCSMNSVVITSGLLCIGELAFESCQNLETIKIPNSVTSIGKHAFKQCYSLNSIEIPDSVTSIGLGAFFDCQHLYKAKLSKNITRIETSTFRACKLESIDIPYGVTFIGGLAFRACHLTSIVLPETLIELGTEGGNPFSDCSRLIEIVNKSSLDIVAGEGIASSAKQVIKDESDSLLEQIDENLLVYHDQEGDMIVSCSKEATNVTIPNGIKKINNYAFVDCTKMSSVEIPETVTTIGRNAFNNCSDLLSITIPNSVVMLGRYAFSNCNKLTEVKLSNTLTSIESYTFYRCMNLVSISIPTSITDIKSNSFSYCTSLTEIFIPLNVVTIESIVFNKCDSLTIYCEVESKPDGWNTNWNSSNCPVVWGYTPE